MKILTVIEGLHCVPGDPTLEAELAAFTARLVKSRIGREVEVTVVSAEDGSVLVHVDQLLKLQAKASALSRIVLGHSEGAVQAFEDARQLLRS